MSKFRAQMWKCWTHVKDHNYVVCSINIHIREEHDWVECQRICWKTKAPFSDWPLLFMKNLPNYNSGVTIAVLKLVEVPVYKHGPSNRIRSSVWEDYLSNPCTQKRNTINCRNQLLTFSAKVILFRNLYSNYKTENFNPRHTFILKMKLMLYFFISQLFHKHISSIYQTSNFNPLYEYHAEIFLLKSS